MDYSLISFGNPANGFLEDNGDTLKYTPDDDFFGEDSFEYTIALDKDPNQTATATVKLSILGSNDNPTGSDVELQTTTDTALRVSVEDLLAQSDAQDVDGDTLKISVQTAQKGSVELVSDADEADYILFTPKDGFTGQASFKYVVEDGNGGRVRLDASVEVVAGNNEPPVAVDDRYMVEEGAELTGNLIDDLDADDASDSDPEGATLAVTQINGIDLVVDADDGGIDGDNLVFDAETGEAQVSIAGGDLFVKADGSFRYVHGGEEPGNTAPQFEYTLSDGELTDTATVTIEITPVNDAPVAADTAFSTPEEQPLELTVAQLTQGSTDAENDTLSIKSFEQPLEGQGSVAEVDGKLVFTPATDFFGEASFDYVITDGNGGDATATATITVTDVAEPNLDPVAGAPTLSATEDTDLIITAAELLAGATDPDGNALTIDSVGSPSSGSLVDNDNDTYTFTPDLNATDDVTFAFTVDDGNGGRDEGQATIEITPVNDAPTGDAALFNTDESTPKSITFAELLSASSAADVDGDDLTITNVAGAENGSLQVDYDNGVITFTPDSLLAGAFDYTISDGKPGGDLALTAAITVTDVPNVGPTATAANYDIDEDGILSVTLTQLLEASSASDADGGTLAITGVGNAVGGTVNVIDDQLTFTPDADYNGVANFDYRVIDGQGGFVDLQAVVNVAAVNDAPVALADELSVNENAILTLSTTSLLGNDIDIDGDEFTGITITSLPASGGLFFEGEAIDSLPPEGREITRADLDANKLSFAPAQGDATVSFAYTVNDGAVSSNEATVTIAVTAVDAVFVDGDEDVLGDEDTQIVGNVLDNAPTSTDDGDVIVTEFTVADDSTVYAAGETATITGVGTLSIASGGAYAFTPDADFNGSVPLVTYSLSDDAGATVGDTSTLAITVDPVNDAPQAVADEATVAATEQVNIDVLANDTDPDSAIDVTSIEITSQPGSGTAVANPDGTITYSADNVPAGQDIFAYRVADAEGDYSDPVQVTVNITGDSLDGNGQDGYISGGFVWADLNPNGQFDPGQEAFGTTNNQGQFDLGGNVSGTLYLTGGVDVATLLPFDGVLRAPEGSTVITPLTTLVVAVLEDNPNLTQDEAEARVKAALELPDVDISDYDPIAVLSDPNADDASKQTAAGVFSTASQVLNTASIAGAAVSGASTGTVSTTEAEGGAFAVLASLVNSATDANPTAPEPVLLTDTTVVQAIVQSTADAAAADTGTSIPVQTQAVADLAVASNTAVETSVSNATSTGTVDGESLLSSVSQVSQVAQGETADAVSDGDVSAEDTEQYVTNLQAEVDEAVVGDADGDTGATDDDILVGTAGPDTLDGGIGNDTIAGNAGDDILIGGEGDDIVTGGPGDDTLIAGPGTDVYKGTATSFDIVDYSSSPTGINVNLQTGIVSEDGFGDTDTLQDIDRVVGSAFDDTLVGRLDAPGIFDRFRPGDGTDFIDGQGGNDAVDYRDAVNPGDPTAGVSIDLGANGTANGTAIDPWGNTDTLLNLNRAFGSAQADTIIGDAQNNVLVGAAGDDTIVTGAGDDAVFGDAGADRLILTGGNDYAEGGADADVFVVGNGSAFIGDYEVGVDAIDFSETTTPVPDLTAVQNALSERVSSDGDDAGTVYSEISLPGLFVTIRGVSNAELFVGGDPLNGLDPANFIGFTAVDQDQVIPGTSSDDELVGGTGNDTFNALEGDDVILGGPGNDIVNGDAGFDALDYSSATSAINVDLGSGTIADGFGGTDTVTSVEKIIGSEFDDVFLGADTDEIQRFEGRGGNDTIVGGSGVNDGIDHRFSDTGVGINANLETGIVLDEFGGTDTVSGIERVYGTIYDDVITGDSNDNQFIGDRGYDIIDGGDGIDTLFANLTEDQGLVIDLSSGTVANDGYGFAGEVSNIENVFGTPNDDVIIGDSGDNLLVGDAGSDVLDGGAGNDVVVAGFNDDAADILIDGAGSDYLEGGPGADTFVIQGGGDDSIGQFELGVDKIDLTTLPLLVTEADLTEQLNSQDAGDGATFLTFGSATLFVNGDTWQPDEELALSDFILPAANPGNLIEGTAGDDTLVGTDGDDIFDAFGNTANGIDFIVGGPGNDLIDGGEGFDAVDYSAAPAGIYADLENGAIADGFGGIDTVSNVERVIGSAFNDTMFGRVDNQGTGLGGFDRFLPGDGADFIDGRGGNDGVDYRGDNTGAGLWLDLALNGEGNGAAIDPYGNVDNILNVSLVFATEDSDVLFGGAENNRLFGFGGDDVIDGRAGDDQLFGSDGSDELRAGDGSDYLEGGTGADTFVVGDGSAFISDFEVGIDTIDFRETQAPVPNVAALETALFEFTGDDPNADDFGVVYSEFRLESVTITLRGVSNDDLRVNGDPNEALDASLFTGFSDLDPDQTINGSPDDDNFDDGSQLDGGSGNDTINGLGGNDALRGFSGADTLDGGEGDDYLEGGFGDDILDGGEGDDNISAGAGNDTIIGGAGLDNANYDSWQFFQSRGVQVNLTDTEVDLGDIVLASGQARDPDGGIDGLDSIEGFNGTQFDDQFWVGSIADTNINDDGTGYFGVGITGGEGNDAVYQEWDSDVRVFFQPGLSNIGFEGDDGTAGDYFFTNGSGHLEFGDLPGYPGNEGQGVGVGYSYAQFDEAGNFVDQPLNEAYGPGMRTFFDDGVDYLGLTENSDQVWGNNTATTYFDLRGGADEAYTGGADRGINMGDDGSGGDGAADVVFHQGGNINIDSFELGLDRVDFTQFPAFISAELLQGQLDQMIADGWTDINFDFGQFGSLYLPIDPTAFVIADNVVLPAVDPDQTIDGTDGDDSFENGTALVGGTGIDTINGGTGNDNLEGGYGDDLLFGQGGDFDSLAGGPGDDLLDGGAGIGDNADYSSFQFLNQRGVIANLSDRTDIQDENGVVVSPGMARDPDFGTDTLVGIENLSGGDYNDWLIGDSGDNFISGWYGDDILEGMGGFDNFAPGSGSDQVYGDGDDNVDYFDYGGQYADGSFQLTVNLSSDDIEFGNIAPGLPFLAANQAQDPDGFIDQLFGISSINGTAGNDVMVGGDEDNGFSGQEGNDILNGGAGNDFLDGGAGSDTFIPGPGFDTVLGDLFSFDILDLSDGTVRAVVDLSQGVVSEDGHLDPDNNPYSDSVSNVNRVIGTGFDDILIGSANPILDAGTENEREVIERFIGGPGDDVIDGNGGTNNGVDYRFMVSPFADPGTGLGVDIDLAANGQGSGTATDPWGNTDTVLNINRVFGSEYNDTIRGGNEDNPLLVGNGGNDVIEGRDGNDFMFGGEGLDTFEFRAGSGQDVIGDFNPQEDDLLLLDGLGVTDVTQIDTDDVVGVDSTLVTFDDLDGSSVLLSNVLLTEQELFG